MLVICVYLFFFELKSAIGALIFFFYRLKPDRCFTVSDIGLVDVSQRTCLVVYSIKVLA